MDSLSRGARSGSNTLGGPESAVIGELVDGRFFSGKFGTHHVKSRLPTGGGEVSEDLFAVRQVHECSAGFVLEITVAELEELGFCWPRAQRSFSRRQRARSVGVASRS